MNRASNPSYRPYRLLPILLSMGLLAACGGYSAEGDPIGHSGRDSESYSDGDSSGDYASADGAEVPDGEDPIADIQAGQLTAGEWRDLDNWSFWLDLLENEEDWTAYESRWSAYTRDRFPIVVSIADDPVIDAEVFLLDASGEPVWKTRTDNRGRAELFNGFFGGSQSGPFTVVAVSGDYEVTIDGITGPPGAEEDPIAVEMTTAEVPPHAVDLMFMIDTTGSMGDELSYIQAELRDVITRVQEQVGTSMDLRLSVNFYRDHGDEYVVRSFPFTSDYAQAISDLQAQSANGGGDYPEAVDMAMENAIFEHDWSEEATARLLFLVLDAPPHNNQESIGRLHQSLRATAEQGVRMIPLMGSGYDRETEYLMRSFAIATGGTFTFLTDHSGIGDSHMEPTVGQYKVELLNDLMVRLIETYSLVP